MILCVTCKKIRDYGNGWVYCHHRKVWLEKGYTKCKGYEEGIPEKVQHPSTWSWIERVQESIEYTGERTQ